MEIYMFENLTFAFFTCFKGAKETNQYFAGWFFASWTLTDFLIEVQ